ncbi:MAG TPA: APC family permease, partial [Methylomirabilota bacterium]|nr:APC family permease [Methylomirabilota bacterium]
MSTTLKRVLVGKPIPTALAHHERLSRVTGLAVFASDALSSTAYATEEILLILVLAGSGALPTSLPISVAIATLIVLVITSYRQTIAAYPTGGGAYVVSRENLGRYPSLVAGSALLTDYVLTVAVSVAAGVAALTSAVPLLYPYRVIIGVLGVALIAVGNLRGVRESGLLFALPAYLFVGTYAVLLGAGGWLWARDALPHLGPATPVPAGEPLTLFLALRAFASGCAALTGIEAVTDGVAAFRAPETRNARSVLATLGLLLVVLFLGLTLLANASGVVPAEGETVNSQIARGIFGHTVPYYLVQVVTALILVIAANTAFADFPRVASFLARDRFLPRQFANRGDRLALSNGIIILAMVSALLLVVFQGSTHALIPLYAVGVFASFTLSQASMVLHWRHRRPAWWIARAALNGVGAAVTGVVMLIIAVTKFTHGAWIVIVLIPSMIFLFMAIRRHYDDVARQLSVEGLTPRRRVAGHTVLVLVGDVHRGTVPALEYAQALSPTARGVYVEVDPEQTRRFEERWARWGSGLPLVVLRSPYRSVAGPLLDYLDHLQKQIPDHLITIILPEFVPARWWQHLLHNQTALVIKAALLFRRGIT